MIPSATAPLHGSAACRLDRQPFGGPCYVTPKINKQDSGCVELWCLGLVSHLRPSYSVPKLSSFSYKVNRYVFQPDAVYVYHGKS